MDKGGQPLEAYPRPFTSRWAPREMLLSPGRSTLSVVFHFLVADMPAKMACLHHTRVKMTPCHAPAWRISFCKGLV